MGIELLIVDDDPLHHKLTEMLLRAHPQVRYRSFLDASDALLHLTAIDGSLLPDLILLDLTMPVVSGWGFLDLFEIISPGLKKNIGIVILTSSLSIADQKRAASYSSVRGFFSKPFSEQLLNDILESSFIPKNLSKGGLLGL